MRGEPGGEGGEEAADVAQVVVDSPVVGEGAVRARVEEEGSGEPVDDREDGNGPPVPDEPEVGDYGQAHYAQGDAQPHPRAGLVAASRGLEVGSHALLQGVVEGCRLPVKVGSVGDLFVRVDLVGLQKLAR